MQQFEILIQNDKKKFYNSIAWIFLFLNFAVFVFLVFYDAYHYPALAFIVALSLYLLMRWYLVRKKGANYLIDEFVFFIPAAGWLGLHSYGVAIGCIVMGILYKLSLQKLQFIFTGEKVVKTNFPRKEFGWQDLNNVILKDHILTLDFKNNRLLQAEIDRSQDINETEFNSFAQSHL